MLRHVCRDRSELRDVARPKFGFTYNAIQNHSTEKSLFEVVYPQVPRQAIDLVVLPTLSRVNKDVEKRVE